MRSILTGFLCLLLPAVAFAQARGEVQSIGFGGHFRPGCWTPMVIKLVPTTGGQFSGRIEVVQEDLDRDQVIFTRQINLTGNSENGATPDQRFWMYFIPQPSKDKGELDANLTLAELTDRIKVRLCTENGKELVQLPITQSIQPMESLRGGNGSGDRGQRSVLCVYDSHFPSFREYQAMTGLTEDVWVVSTREIASGLPDSVIGYDGIDTILWTDADPYKLSADQMTALEDFVKRGGKLVISQDTATNQWQRNGVKFASMMPVTVLGVEDRDDKAATVRLLAGVPFIFPPFSPTADIEIGKDWDRLKGPFRYAAAQVKQGASVVQWQTDDKGEPLVDANGAPKPYIVRIAVGAGSVTWVAQDLGDKQLLGNAANLDDPQSSREFFSTRGWTKIWDKVFDWPNEPVLKGSQTAFTEELRAQPYARGATWELGRSTLEFMDLPSTSAALIGIAVLFFVIYWVGAGPGSYFVLSKKGKSALSWFAFAAIAIGATGLTAGIVKLVLRGAPQLQHVTVMRMAPGEPVWIHSDFGLYIPRDGYQKIELKDAAPGRASYITAYNLHPAFNGESAEFPARQEYQVTVKELHEADREATDPKVIRVPYRSTLKKFQAEWIGNNPPGLTGGIDGTVKLSGATPLVNGDLINNTGHDLRMVYFVVHNPGIELYDDKGTTVGQDLVLYVSFWPKGGKVSLTKQFDALAKGGASHINPTKDGEERRLTDTSNPNAVIVFQGRIKPDVRVNATENWPDIWYKRGEFRQTSGYVDNHDYTEKDPLTPNSFPILSFFDRLPVTRNQIGMDGKIAQNDRVNFLRRGVRDLDLSASISAGNMAIIAVSNTREEELPFNLEVQGDQIKGKGIIYYQFIVPVDRSAVLKTPTSQPTTKPKGKAEG